MSPKERAIYIVKYGYKTFIPKTKKMFGFAFQQESYSRWAALELISRLKASELPPLIVMEDFCEQMDRFSTMNRMTSYLFSTAKDMTEWMIDLLIS